MSLELADEAPISFPAAGQVFQVAIGYEDVLIDLGTFAARHVAVSGPPRVLKIEASALDQALSLKSQREQTWESTTLGDMVMVIAKRNGLKPSVVGELGSIRIEHELQTESDIAFLTRLGRGHGMIIKLSGQYLMAMPEDKSRKASGGQLPAIYVSSFLRYEYSDEQSTRYTGVRAFWYDNNAVTKRQVLYGKEGVVLELEFNKVSEAAARNAAEAKFRDVVRKGKRLSFTVTGNCELAAESKCVVSGIREGVDGEWVIKSVEHTIDGSGFQSSVDCSVDGYK